MASVRPVVTADDAQIEEYTGRQERVRVCQNPGFLVQISATATIDYTATAIFDILRDPDNARFFRVFKEIPFRQAVADDLKGVQKVEIKHVSLWKVLAFSGTFTTWLYLIEDANALTIHFQLKEPGMMKRFEGFWKVQPLIDKNGKLTGSSLVTLEQNLLPCVYIPPGLDYLLKTICCRNIRWVMEDLRAEIARLKAGKPIPQDQRKKMKAWQVQSWNVPTG